MDLRRRLPAEPLVGFSLLMLGAMLSLPYLVPFHYEPVGSFHAEWLAALLGLLAGIGLLSNALREDRTMPAVALLPLALLALVLIQLAVGVVNLWQQSLMFALYLIWAWLLALLGARLRRRLGLVALCDWLAAALLAGALAGAVAALVAHSDLFMTSPWIFSNRGRPAMIGNIAQPNHLANQLWMGVAAGLYLAHRQRLRGILLGLALALLVAVGVLTASRATLLYLAAFVVLAGYARLLWPGEATTRTLRLTLFLAVVYAFSQIVVGLQGGESIQSPVQKIAATGGSIRLQLVQIAWQAFLSAPLLGHGIGSFPPLSLALAGRLPFGTAPGTIEHAHNLILQLLAEMGIAAPLLVVGMAALWLLDLRRQADRADTDEGAALGWILAVLTVGAIHSMVEYPLWYTFFLGPTAVLLGAGDGRPRRLPLAPWLRLVVVPLTLLGGGTLALLRIDYVRLENAVNPWLAGESRTSVWQDMLRVEAPLKRNSLIYPYLCPVAVTRLRMPPTPLPDALEISDCAMHVLPVARVVLRRALVLAYAGRSEEAAAAWRMGLTAYPREAPQAARELRAIIKENPGVAALTSLLALADQTARRLPADGRPTLPQTSAR